MEMDCRRREETRQFRRVGRVNEAITTVYRGPTVYTVALQ